MTRLRRPETWVVGGLAVQAAAAIAFALLTARWLGPDGRGVIVLYVTLGSFLMLIGSLGVNTGARVLMARDPPDLSPDAYRAVVTRLAVLHVLTSVAIGAPLLVVLAEIPVTDITTVAFAPYSVLQLVALLLREGLHGTGDHLWAAGGDALQAVFQLGLLVLLRAQGVVTLTTVIVVLIVASAVQVLLLWLRFCVRSVSAAGAPTRTLRSLVGYSLPAMFTAFGQAFVFRGDRLILGALSNVGTVGTYSVAATASELVWLLPNGVAQVVFRRTSHDGDLAYLYRIRRVVMGLCFLGAVACVVGLTWAIPAILGTQYGDAVPLAQVLAVAALPICSYYLDVAALNGLGELARAQRVTWLGALVLTGTCLVLVPLLGGMGAALASLLAYSCMAVRVRCEVRACAPAIHAISPPLSRVP